MATVEERLASLEGRVNEHTQTFAMMRDSLSLLRDAVASLDRRMDRFEQRIDSRFDGVDRWLRWIVALFATSTIAIITAILARG